jgi:hypothetical protein
MGALGVGLVFIGYVLMYAGLANHGKFATAPWNGVTQDAYDE